MAAPTNSPGMLIANSLGAQKDRQSVTSDWYSLQEAIEAPRLNSRHFHSSFENKIARPGVLEIEDRVPPFRAAIGDLHAHG